MCLLTYFPGGMYPEHEAIEGLTRGSWMNPDGHGYAIVSGGKIHSFKSMDAAKTVDQFLLDREEFIDGPAIFHSRIGTDGWNDVNNCHPFQIGKDQNTVIAHNGILPSLARPTEKHDPRSDTRILAEELLPEKPFGYFHSPLARAAFEEWLGPFNKVIILTTNPRYPDNVLMFNAHRGHWAYGAWWSNDSYTPYTPPKASKSPIGYTIGKGDKSADVDDELNLNCLECKQEGSIDKDYRVCWTCGTCADCLGNWTNGECLCYLPSRGSTKSLQKCTDCNKYVCICDDV